ncbi:hypothetical protein [Streptomyces sp. HNM0574]|uniref:hypothetical protein n=1 Tax=Streptomyces sp. HNM0574 TaxID=2714954 RepID=UPI00146D59BD|nr:hypothetical protein [Streptomyces sp. HNM0574]NLU70633.1 hypothetical protein [Streptomyces sp. HNM0574]
MTTLSDTTDTTITVELSEQFDPRWSRLPGITVDGHRLTLDPEAYFFRFESHSWLLADWELVKSELLPVQETAESAVEQLALDFITAHAAPTKDAESIKAHAALGGRLVHGCQSVPDQAGGVVAPYGTAMPTFRDELAALKGDWLDQVYAHRPAQD